MDWTCIERLPLRKFVIFFFFFDMFWGCLVYGLSATCHFLYDNPGGVSSFLHYKLVNHVDVFKFRRFQPWELEGTVALDDSDKVWINETRIILDKYCSRYGKNAKVAGDPGDYLKEVIGRPYSSGYNNRIAIISRFWLASMTLIVMSTPTLLLAIWWRQRRGRIVTGYVLIQSVAAFLLVGIRGMMFEHLMCATEYAYGGKPMRTYFGVIISIIIGYTLVKFVVLGLFVLERKLKLKRADHGFPTRRIIRRTVKVVPFLEEENKNVEGGKDRGGESETGEAAEGKAELVMDKGGRIIEKGAKRSFSAKKSISTLQEEVTEIK